MLIPKFGFRCDIIGQTARAGDFVAINNGGLMGDISRTMGLDVTGILLAIEVPCVVVMYESNHIFQFTDNGTFTLDVELTPAEQMILEGFYQ